MTKLAMIEDRRGAPTYELFDLDGVQLHFEAQHLFLVFLVDDLAGWHCL